MSVPIIYLKNISFHFEGRELFNNLNLIINKSEKVVITGGSGKGKTTLLKSILGFSFPSSGEIKYNNLKLNNRTIHHLRNEIAWIPQEITFLGNTVRDFICFPFQFQSNLKNKPSKEKINVLLEKFSLNQNILDQNFNNVSGGEKQRLAIIVAFLLERKIFIADEPTSALDFETKKIVISEILDNNNFTVLSVSHDLDWIKHNQKIIEL